MSARFYDPGLGAFTQLDSYAGSAQDSLSLNRYLYAEANPTTLIDPTGHGACLDDAQPCTPVPTTSKSEPDDEPAQKPPPHQAAPVDQPSGGGGSGCSGSCSGSNTPASDETPDAYDQWGGRAREPIHRHLVQD
jgi:hypothetical protein